MITSTLWLLRAGKCFLYQTRCCTKTDKSTTVNIIQWSCGFSSKQEKTQKFKNEHASILFHLFARILGSRLQLLLKTVKIRMNQIVQLTIFKSGGVLQTPHCNWLSSKICCRYAEIAWKKMQRTSYCRCWNYTSCIVWNCRCPLKQRTFS